MKRSTMTGRCAHTLWYDQPGIGAGKGTKYIEQSLRWAREADPKAKLFYNDYDAEEINRKSDAIYAMAKDFKKRGVPLDGVGFQTHINLKFDDPAKLESLQGKPGTLRQARPRIAHDRTRCSPQQRRRIFTGCRRQALRRNHETLRANNRRAK